MYKFVLCCALSCSAGLVLAGSDEKIYSVSEDAGVTAPVLVQKVEPKYTQEARDAKIQGSVKLQVEVSREGLPEKIAVKESLEPGLDQNAMDALKTWRFTPAIKDGQPVRVKALVEINFRLK